MKASLAVLLYAVPMLTAAPRPSVLIFARTDCPILNRYAPEVTRIFTEFSNRVDFHLVYVEPGLTAGGMERHRTEYGLPIPAILDTDRKYTRMAGATVTPQAAVFVDGKLIYRGRIDDRYPTLGTMRAQPLHRDLADVLAAVAAGRIPPPHFTKAIGCAIEASK